MVQGSGKAVMFFDLYESVLIIRLLLTYAYDPI